MANNDKEIELIRRFNRRYAPAMQILDRTYLDTGRSAREVSVLLEISENEGCNASELSSWLKMDKGYLSRILSSYARDGLIERTPSASDGRVLSIALTEQGRRVADDLSARGSKVVREAFSGIGAEELKRIASSFRHVLELIDGRGEEGDE